jgi:hypothetical protein
VGLREFENTSDIRQAISNGMLRFDTGQTAAWFAGLMQLNMATEQDRIILNIQDWRSS